MGKRTSKNRNNFNNKIIKHLSEYIKEYIIIVGIFTIGIIIGVVSINTLSSDTQNIIKEYVNNSLLNFNNENLSSQEVILSSIKQNMIFVTIIWFFGCTGIGSTFIYLLLAFKGYCISYSIASFVATLGIWKGILFTTSYLLLPNIILIALIFYISVKGIVLNKNILNNNGYKNIKLEIAKHVLMFFVIILALLITAIIETYLSRRLLGLCMKYII